MIDVWLKEMSSKIIGSLLANFCNRRPIYMIQTLWLPYEF